ncbi:MAG: pyrrolo-quinoline quinone [Candidatus Sulfotelmatobacter sp.]|nr:pyrrolo-quinoline quinone [Candidatus Sulfotelmatobacter sp.]
MNTEEQLSGLSGSSARASGTVQMGRSKCFARDFRLFSVKVTGRIVLVLVTTLLAASSIWAADSQYTQRGSSTRAGLYDGEVFLTPQNVNSVHFGSVFSYNVDGTVVAQPLYVPGVNIPGVGVVNVIYVATQHDSVYAFNAETFASGQPLWRVNFLNPANGVTTVPIAAQGCSGITGFTEVGIMGTPVIDSASNTIFVVAKTQESVVINGVTTYNYVFRLHALDIATGAEKIGSPAVITASVMHGGVPVTLNTQNDQQRPGLLEANGSIFIAFGSNGCDRNAHGWLLAYSASTLQQQGVFNTSPGALWGSSLWMGGVGPAADAANNIYLITANGNYDIYSGGADWGDTVLKMNLTASGLVVADSFTPFNQATMSQQDLDLGSGAAVLLPQQSSGPQNLLVAAGKTGTIYLINRDRMGGYNPVDNVVQELPGAVTPILGAPVYWNNAIYFAGRNDNIKAFPFVNGVITTPPVQTANPYTLTGIPVVSANNNGNGILWVIRNLTPSSSTTLLSAFDASTLQTNLLGLYDTQQNSARDALGAVPHFASPLVANGRVYIGTNTQLKVYGLFPELNPSAGNLQSATVNTPITLTAQAINAYTGAATPGVPVTFSDGGLRGVFNPATANTNSSGNATTSYTLPKTAGALTITATSSGYTAATFSETATAGPAASLATVSGFNQSGTVGTTLPAPLVAKVKDAYGNIVANAQVTFSSAGLNGTFQPNPATTGTNGQASTTFTLPTAAKTNFSVNAASGSATPAIFHETSTAGAPTTVNTSGGNKQTGTSGTQLPVALQVTVKDKYGNGVPNITVTFSDNGSGGSLSASSPVTNSQGQAGAFYTLPAVPGTWTITATVSSLKITFTEFSK